MEGRGGEGKGTVKIIIEMILETISKTILKIDFKLIFKIPLYVVQNFHILFIIVYL